MQDRVRFSPLLGVVVLALALAGCSTGSNVDVAVPTPVKSAPNEAAAAAMEAYDANDDGKIAAAELDQCLALKYSLPRVDANGDKAVSADEIARRIEAYENQSKLSGVSIQVFSRQGPVSGATVNLEMEPFMGPDLPSYVVTTDASGSGTPVLQESGQIVVGVPIGFYRVTISTPEGEEVIRGCEIADDAPTANRIVFSLEDEAPQGGGGGRFGR